MILPATPRAAKVKAAMLLVTGLLAALLAAPLYAGPAVGGVQVGGHHVERNPLPRIQLERHAGKVEPLAAVRVQNKGISRDQAASLVKRRYGGKILAISEVQRNGRTMYRVKGLSDKSQVYVVYVDKETGQISG
ncbi:PepSY domain-containing protein [Microbulbifer pacificus]|uniref:PepSY domain-containing protein n=1 Tax=Microbulbifer pacificus TaxID=407164 RepID=A0AAU0N200_9GAMM|nr:PepSY domain-containing protein [Microbulbifer pacificus]WOX06284.1 PepSY domain-containing protein [Microbulbifer pacificus]